MVHLLPQFPNLFGAILADSSLHFWTSPDLTVSDFIPSATSSEDVEQFFDQIYAPYKTVLFSSARLALRKVLEAEGLSRTQDVWLSDYSSHCVVNAVSIAATPKFRCEDPDAFVVFHNYGHQKIVNTKAITVEDSADSFIAAPSALFPNLKSRFEILSLPKIYGSYFGGLVLCKTEEDARQMKNLRSHGIISPTLLGLFRALKHVSPTASYAWEGCEIYGYGISNFMVRNIARKVKEHPRVLERRKENLEVIRDILGLKISDKGRFPCSFFLDPSEIQASALKKYPQLVRHVYEGEVLQPGQITKKMFLVPVHQDVPANRLRSLLQEIYLKREVTRD